MITRILYRRWVFWGGNADEAGEVPVETNEVTAVRNTEPVPAGSGPEPTSVDPVPDSTATPRPDFVLGDHGLPNRRGVFYYAWCYR